MLDAIKWIQIDPDLDVRQRLREVEAWQAIWQQEDTELQQRLERIDLNARMGEDLASRMVDMKNRLKMNQVRQPFGVVSSDSVAQMDIGALLSRIPPQYAQLSQAERLAWLNNFLLILTPDMYSAIQKIDHLLLEASARQRRGLLLTGQSRMGKSSLLDFLWCQFRPTVEEERNLVPIVKVEAPASSLSTVTLPRRIVLEFGLTYTAGENEERLTRRAGVFTQRCGTRILVIDEAENIHTERMQRKLIELWNSFPNVIIICASCDIEMFLGGSEQLRNRWDVVHELRAFDFHRLRGLLSLLALLLPFSSLSEIFSDDMTTFFLEKTGGNLWRVMNLIHESSKVAIEDNLPCLTLELLERVWENNIHATTQWKDA
jgi:hypothetical protein